MKTYQLGEHIVTVKKCAGEYVVIISRKDCATKSIELPPKR